MMGTVHNQAAEDTPISQPAAHTTTLALITNPAADNGKGEQYGRQVLEHLQSQGPQWNVQTIDITGRDRDESLLNARNILQDVDAVVVVGGDGMVSLGANAVANTGVPLGVVAAGSGNDFVRCLGHPVGRVIAGTEAVLASLVARSTIDIDLAKVVSAEDGGKRINRYIAGMLNCSIDAAINARANNSKLPIGMLRYMAAGLWEVLHVQDYGYRIQAQLMNGQTHNFEINTPLVAIANARYIGGGIEVSPRSQLDDGILEMLWTKWHPTAQQALHAFTRAYHGQHLQDPIFGYDKITSVRIDRNETGSEPPMLMADGEPLGHLPVEVTVQHRALRMLVPVGVRKQWDAGTLPQMRD